MSRDNETDDVSTLTLGSLTDESNNNIIGGSGLQQENDENQEESSLRLDSTNQDLLKKKKMTHILNLIENKKINDLFDDESLYYYFLKICVVNVITRSKWKENCTNYDFDRFIHPTDEAFALLVLDNNLERYRDMANRPDVSKHLLIPPKYTTVTKMGQKTQVRGWSDSGKLQFQQYTQFVRNVRSKNDWMIKTRKSVKRKCKKEFRNRRKRKDRDVIDDDDSIKKMNREEINNWNSFLSETVNNDDWYTNSVSV